MSGPLTYGIDYNYFKILQVNNTTFNNTPDVTITSPGCPSIFLAIIDGYGVLNYSFNGGVIHGQMIMGSATGAQILNRAGQNRIWFKVQTSLGCTVQIQAGDLEFGPIGVNNNIMLPSSTTVVFPQNAHVITDPTSQTTTLAGSQTTVTSLPTLPSGSNTIGAVTQASGPWSISGTVTSNQGSANTLINKWPVQITDGTNAAAVKAGSAAAGAADPSLVVAVSPNSPLPAGTNAIGTVTASQATAANLNATVAQGAPNTTANSWPMEITDGTHGPAAIKTGSAAVSADNALVVSLSPNNSALSGVVNSSWNPNPSNVVTTTTEQVGIDTTNRLEVHAGSYTDEGSFRDDFIGSSLTTALSGTVTFTNLSTAVTGSGTSFTTQVKQGQYIKKSGDSETLYCRVQNVVSDTNLILTTAYQGTTQSGQSAIVSNWITVTGTGGSFSVSLSDININSGTTNGQSTYITRTGDYLPMILTSYMHVTQRVANQTVIVGFRDNWASPTRRCEIQFSGTDNTKVNFVVACDSAASDIQTFTITLPSSFVTSDDHTYVVALSDNIASFTIDGVLLASASLHIPGPYDTLNLFAGIQNTGTVTNTILNICMMYFSNLNQINIANQFQGNPIITKSTIDQNVSSDTNNSSTTNLAPGAIFTGVWSSTLNVAALQVTLHTDQNCTVYVDQGPDGYNTDVTDQYNYNALKDNFGVTTQAISSYYRVRIKNVSSATTTSFRLNFFLCPVVDAIPRALDSNLNFKTAIYALNDEYGNKIKASPVGSLQVNQPYRLVGATFVGNTIDNSFWTPTTGGAGTGEGYSASGGIITLSSTSSGTGYAQITSVRSARFILGNPNQFRGLFRIPTAVVSGSLRRWGAYTIGAAPSVQDGFCFELNSAGVLSCVCYNNGSISYSVSNGNFNGETSIYNVDQNVHIYEITYHVASTLFIIDGVLIHTFTPATTMLSSNFILPVTAVAYGTGTQCTMEMWVGTIQRLGRSESAPLVKYQHGATTGTGIQLKLGAGTLRTVTLNAYTNSTTTVSFYDATSAANAVAIIAPGGGGGAGTPPLTLTYNLDFYVGLWMAVAGSASDITVTLE